MEDGALTIRRAKSEDKEAIRKIYRSALDDETREDSNWGQLLKTGGIFVAQKGGKIVGFGGIDTVAAEQIRWLYILVEYQRTGLGSEILKQMETLGWEAGLSSLRLHSSPGAVQFYQRHGYQIVLAAVPHDHEGTDMVKERPV